MLRIKYCMPDVEDNFSSRRDLLNPVLWRVTVAVGHCVNFYSNVKRQRLVRRVSYR